MQPGSSVPGAGKSASSADRLQRAECNRSEANRVDFVVVSTIGNGNSGRVDVAHLGPMVSPLSLSNVLTVLVALLCLWTMSPQARGGVMRLWRLGVPAAFAAVVSLMLLSSVFAANFRHDIEWVIALALGGVVGRTRGWTLPIDIDHRFGLVRLPRSRDCLFAAYGIVAAAVIDFGGAALEEQPIGPEHLAAFAALCAGFIGCRALAIIVRSTRAPHVGLNDATRG
jgi:hypothetical protein